jgi:hypothetical protein
MTPDWWRWLACAVKGHVGDISRFASRAAFAAYNGMAKAHLTHLNPSADQGSIGPLIS